MFKKLIILIVLSFVLISCDSKKEISQNPIMTKKEYNYIIEKVDKYLDKGEYKEAIKLLLKAAEYNKSDYKKIAWIYSQISGEEGEKWYKIAYEKGNEDVAIILGLYAEKRKDYVAQEKYLRKAVDNNQKDSYKYLGNFFEKMDRTSEAIEIYKKGAENKDAVSMYNLIKKYYIQNDIQNMKLYINKIRKTKEIFGFTYDINEIINYMDGNSNDKKAIKLTGTSGGGTTLRTPGGTPIYSGGTWSQVTVGGGVGTTYWTYTRADNTLLQSGWAYIDSDGDGKAECYYFENGKMAASKTVDGYELNSDGQWVENGVVKQYDIAANNSANNNSSSGLASDMNKAKFNNIEFADTIHPTSVFPISSTDFSIAGTDGKENGNPNSRLIHYGIFVNVNLYKSQMYGGWLDTLGEGSGGSLNWWNGWLRKAKFTYSIDKNKLAEYLNVNFTADTTDADKDAVVLDKNTLMAIQQQITKETRNDFINTIRTWFVALGFMCFIYGIALVGAWALDVNTMLAFKLLGILTFGKCIAVSDDIDKPATDNGKLYMTFSGVMFRLIALAGLGIILINVDFLVVVGNMYNAIKNLTDFISKGLFGA